MFKAMENNLRKTGIVFDLKKTIVTFSPPPVPESKEGACGS
jgi:hypothetical protein